MNTVFSIVSINRGSKDVALIVSFCDRSTMQLFCICLVVYCFKVLVVITYRYCSVSESESRFQPQLLVDPTGTNPKLSFEKEGLHPEILEQGEGVAEKKFLCSISCFL